MRKRTATEIDDLLPRACIRASDEVSGQESTPLADFRGVHGYALLGDPGSGKTSAFEKEARASAGVYMAAGEFLHAGPTSWPTADQPIFIDGLDETRAGSTDGRVPIITIVKKLTELGIRYFRISCRAADWLGNPDLNRLQSALPSGQQFEVLRLVPLTLTEVADLLKLRFGLADPAAFIQKAREQRLEDVLFNPQTLTMLAEAVAGGVDWPDNRRDVYDLACKRLSEEHNEEHEAATRDTAPNHAMLRRAAGCLSALFLISDLRGFTLIGAAPTRTLAIKDLSNSEQLPLREAVRTRLFREVVDGVFAPVHRTVAEFLAAEFLAGHLGRKLTVRRVLALMCGGDGGVVSALRGLNAWLATLSFLARSRSSELDPMGVLTYGDVATFPPSDKSRLLDAIQAVGNDASRFRWEEWDSSTFSPLATDEMLPELVSRLQRLDRSEGAQIIMLGLAQGLEHNGRADPSALPALEGLVRDPSCDRQLRRAAFASFISGAGPDSEAVKGLLRDLATGKVEDRNDELLGTALQRCYPIGISAADVVQYLHAPKQEGFFGQYRMFWSRGLARATPDAELGALLDAFAEAGIPLRITLSAFNVAWPMSPVLARALEQLGDDASDGRLLDWLEACCDEHCHTLLKDDPANCVRDWFAARPERYLGVLDQALLRREHVYKAIDCLHSAPQPSDMALWWLAKVEAESDDERAAQYLKQATWALPDEWSVKLDQMLAECWRVAQNRGLVQQLEQLLSYDLEQWEWKRKGAAQRRKEREASARRREEYLRRLPDLALKQAPLGLLNGLARVHEGRFSDFQGNTGEERLTVLADGDEQIVKAALNALATSVLREDLPSVEETLTANADGKLMTLHAPALIGMQIRFRGDPAFIDGLAEDKLKSLLLAHFVGLGETSLDWVRYAAQHRPQTFAGALAEYVDHEVMRMRRRPHCAHAMTENGDYEVPARLCLMGVLQRFPSRAGRAQNDALEDMLQGALRLLPAADLLSLTVNKLSVTKMDGRQRAMWIAAGLRLDPAVYQPKFEAYVRRSLTRIGNVGEFLHHRENDCLAALPTTVVASLAEHLAPGCSHERPTKEAFPITTHMRRADFVQKCLNELAARPEEAAAVELRRLESAPKLSAWSRHVSYTRGLQRAVFREASFEHPSVGAVCAALEQGAPTTPSEIFAIVNDTLEALAEEVSHSGEFNLRRQFWNFESNKKTTVPKHEVHCRDVLGGLLKVRLERFSITCIPENHHPEGKRSDLWCMVGQAGVPIEAKRDSHSELWTATRGQLMARYASDLRARGFGIYLVFWFASPKMSVPPSGTRPKDPEELRKMLIEQLTREEQQVIAVHVIDCQMRLDLKS